MGTEYHSQHKMKAKSSRVSFQIIKKNPERLENYSFSQRFEKRKIVFPNVLQASSKCMELSVGTMFGSC